jgi:Transposase
MRAFGLDVHRDFCEVAIAEEGRIRSAGRIPTRVESLELFAQSLVASDVVALGATTGADKIVSLLQAHGVRVVVANTRKLKSITEAKAKTDRLDARTLARLLVSGLLDEVWTPDERTRTLRRLTNRRERLVRARTRAKNGKGGRRWLARLELPLDGALLAPAHPGGGIRLRPAGDDAQQGQPARAARRRSRAEGPQGHRRQQVEGTLRRRTRALPPGRGGLPAAGQRLALERPTESGCGRDTGARIFLALEGQSRAADSVSPNGLRFASSVTRTRRKDPTGRRHRPLDFHPSVINRLALMPCCSKKASARATKPVTVCAFSSSWSST